MINLGVVGSREFDDYRLMKIALVDHVSKIKHIVSGGARGADRLAERFAKEFNIPTIIHVADWKPNGILDRGAGYKRNKLIVRDSDAVIAFHNGSPGTKHTLSLCQQHGVPYTVIRF